MAKKPASGGRTASAHPFDAAEETRLARLAAAAIAKQRDGKPLSRGDAKALREWEDFQRTKYGEQHLERLPKKDVARFTGRQPRTLIDWAERYNLPYDRHSNTVDARRWFAFIADLLAEKGRFLYSEDSAEDDLLHLASGPLKDELVRRLIEKNDIANSSARMDLEIKRGSYVPLEPIRDFHNEAAGMIAKLGETASRRDMIPGYEVQQMIEQLTASFEALARRKFGSNGSDDQENT